MYMEYPKYPGSATKSKLNWEAKWNEGGASHAESCFDKIADGNLQLSSLKSPYTAKPMLRKFYNNAVLHTVKTQKERVRVIVEWYLAKTVANDEKEKEPGCILGTLLEGFKDDVTLPDKNAEDAVNTLAGRLIDLLKKLGQKPIDGRTPGCS